MNQCVFHRAQCLEADFSGARLDEADFSWAVLKSAGAARVYLAGRRLDIVGVDEEVGMGSDVLDVLTRALDQLGVE